MQRMIINNGYIIVILKEWLRLSDQQIQQIHEKRKQDATCWPLSIRASVIIFTFEESFKSESKAQASKVPICS